MCAIASSAVWAPSLYSCTSARMSCSVVVVFIKDNATPGGSGKLALSLTSYP
jgi:hypothetical protein